MVKESGEGVNIDALLHRKIMGQIGYSLHELYCTLVDPATRSAYGMPKTADPLVFSSSPSISISQPRELRAKKIIPPGLSLPEKERNAFVTPRLRYPYQDMRLTFISAFR